MANSLYLCYFGLLEPLVQTQVLPYLRELIKDGHQISLLTFEPEIRSRWTPGKIQAMQDKLAEEGIRWDLLPYHKRFSVIATGYDILKGALFVNRVIARGNVDILHGRVHIPVLMAALARKFSKIKPKILFDIRGFFPEEYTDAGRWPEKGWIYRAAKRIEKWLLRDSDGFVVLTEKAREILFPESKYTGSDKFGRPVEVIPCCVDLDRFGSLGNGARSRIRGDLGLDSRTVITYVGSFGGWYMTDAMVDFFSTAHANDKSTFAMVLTQRGTGVIEQRLIKAGLSKNDFLVKSIAPDEIPRYVAAADLAISFIKPCYSKLSSSPTKIAEYLACGVPIIANGGVGDVAEMISRNNVGTIVTGFEPKDFAEALFSIQGTEDMRERCREAAVKEFSLATVAGTRYRSLYRRLMEIK